MYNRFIKNSLLIACVCAVSGCSSFFDTDNTPKPKALTSFTAQIKPRLLWKTSTGAGAGDEFLKLSPSMNDHAVFTSSVNGVVSSTNKANGKNNWRTNTGLALSTGPGSGDGIVVVGSVHGNIVALNEATGHTMWSANMGGELIASPAVSQGHVIVKALNGSVEAFAVSDGHKLWSFKQSEPDLILRGSSTPLVRDNQILTGFANGNLASVALSSGNIMWIQQVAAPEGIFAIERMTDIDADPIIYGHRIYAATYQGNIASLDWHSGRPLWSHKISSYTGMTADDNSVYISDAKSNVWAFGADNGEVSWQQANLEARTISSPADMGNYIVVGDAEGYLHWLSKRDGHFAAREYIGSGVLAKPLVDNNILYALTTNGNLAAYQIGS
jgi:outer membrane protein assembly factor BamB